MPYSASYERAVDAILFDRVLRNLQAGLRFLRLFLNASGVNSVEPEVVVVAGAAGKANRALVAASVVLREGSEKSEARPVAAVVREIRRSGLVSITVDASAELRFAGALDALTSICSLIAPTPSCDVQGAGLADQQHYTVDDSCFEPSVSYDHRIVADCQSRK